MYIILLCDQTTVSTLVTSIMGSWIHSWLVGSATGADRLEVQVLGVKTH